VPKYVSVIIDKVSSHRSGQIIETVTEDISPITVQEEEQKIFITDTMEQNPS
jgi:hypothetical protein